MFGVQLKDTNGGSSCRCRSSDSQPLASEVFLPFLSPGMKEFNHEAAGRIDSCQIASLPKIAGQAGEGEVFRLV